MHAVLEAALVVLLELPMRAERSADSAGNCGHSYAEFGCRMKGHTRDRDRTPQASASAETHRWSCHVRLSCA
jgi:hypothetical protein